MQLKSIRLLVGMGSLMLASSVGAADWAVASAEKDGLTGPQQMTNALTQAQSGDVIRVEPGVYDLSTVRMATDACLVLSAPVTIMGTDETSWRTAPGGETATVFDAKGECRILRADGIVAPTVRNITFRNAKTTGNGGAVSSDKDWTQRPTLTNCVFVSCAASQGGAGLSVVFRDCFVTNCSATSQGGGGIRCDFYDSRVVGCVATGKGGGVSNPRALVRTVFVGNKGTDGGAASLESTGTLTDCVFSNNWATGQCGAVLAQSGQAAAKTLVARGCTFAANRTDAWGGACGNVRAVTNCTFIGNVYTSNNESRSGGAALSGATSNVVDCVFVDNESKGNGGAVSGSANLLRCAFTNNVAARAGAAVIQCQGVKDCTFVGNRAPQGAVARSREIADCRFAVGDVAPTGFDCYATTNIVQSLFVNDTAQASTNGVGSCVGVIACTFSNAVAWSSTADRCGFFAHRDNNVPVLSQSFVTNALMTGCESAMPIGAGNTLVNCTVISNNQGRLDRQLIAGNLTAVNCIFRDNFRRLESGTEKSYDLAGYGTWTFVNCLYLTHPGWNVGDKPTYTFNDTDCVYTSAPLFVKPTKPAFDPAHPYKLKLRSPARDAGVAVEGLAEALDFAGAERLNGTVDIGCYECWLEPTGALLIIR